MPKKNQYEESQKLYTKFLYEVFADLYTAQKGPDYDSIADYSFTREDVSLFYAIDEYGGKNHKKGDKVFYVSWYKSEFLSQMLIDNILDPGKLIALITYIESTLYFYASNVK